MTRRWKRVAVVVVALCAAFATEPASAQESIVVSRWALVVGGEEIAAFTDARVTSSSVAPRRPSLGATGRVVLSRPQTSNLEMWTWHEAFTSGAITTRPDVTLIGFGADGKPMVRYHLTRAWPAEITALKASGNEVAMEELLLYADSVQRVAN